MIFWLRRLVIPRVVLIHEGSEIALSPGPTLIGRALYCQLRFNEPSISREHLRIFVSDAGASAENLSRTNGTLVNGELLAGARRLADRDKLQFGFRRLTVRIHPDPGVAAAGKATGDREELANETTRPGDFPVGVASLQAADRAHRMAIPSLAHIQTDPYGDRNCPRCRARVPAASDVCPSCGYEWPFARPGSVTQEIDVGALVRRAHRRLPVELPAVYVSESLTIDGMVRDISPGGLFIASELLDAVGTACELTVLPDGFPAIVFGGVVVHVQSEGGPHRLPGLGIQFTRWSVEADAWLRRLVSARSQPSP